MSKHEIFLPRYVFALFVLVYVGHLFYVWQPRHWRPGDAIDPRITAWPYVFFGLFGLLADIVDYVRRRWIDDDDQEGYWKVIFILTPISFLIMIYLFKMVVAVKFMEPWWQ